jgi:hypothetical protein
MRLFLLATCAIFIAATDAQAARPNPPLGRWTVVNPATCSILGAEFGADRMVFHYPASKFDKAFDRATPDIYYQVNPGEVMIHDRASALNVPTFEFEGPDLIRFGNTAGACKFRRVP